MEKTQKPQILLVDDTPEQLIVMGTLLEAGDMKVFTAASGQEGIYILQKEKIDCIVCDIFMPGMNGGEFVTRVREIESMANLPVIMLTSATDDLEMDMLISGADLFCEKRHATKNLIKQIKLLLD